MPQTEVTPYCVLESWDTIARAWRADPDRHASIASAREAARERGVYRVVVVHGDAKTEMDLFAIV